jgi:two-component system, NarL family, response regulator LiaR
VSESDPVRVVIADDSELFYSALGAILDPEPGVVVLGYAADGDEALRLARELRPDVVLMDLSMPVLDGFVATERIRAEVPETQVVVLTGSADDGDVERARAAGAAGYITKDRIAGELVDALRTAAQK